ncbi:DUF1542 domain-containing protein, partial [Campylobacter jejuni]|uniref:DUF1542 domain-containing protein n=1 Tax=Campylobacter jejuni TaxID=197 RepID=UPI003B98691D
MKDAADQAKTAINTATTDADVTSAKNAGLAKVGERHDATVKQTAKDAIDAKVQEANNAIDQNRDMT